MRKLGRKLSRRLKGSSSEASEERKESTQKVDTTWSTAQARSLGKEPNLDVLRGKVDILDKETHKSVQKTILALNAGGITASFGLVALFSQSMDEYWMLWRADREADADKIFDQLYNPPPALPEGWAEIKGAEFIAEDGEEHSGDSSQFKIPIPEHVEADMKLDMHKKRDPPPRGHRSSTSFIAAQELKLVTTTLEKRQQDLDGFVDVKPKRTSAGSETPVMPTRPTAGSEEFDPGVMPKHTSSGSEPLVMPMSPSAGSADVVHSLSSANGSQQFDLAREDTPRCTDVPLSGRSHVSLDDVLDLMPKHTSSGSEPPVATVHPSAESVDLLRAASEQFHLAQGDTDEEESVNNGNATSSAATLKDLHEIKATTMSKMVEEVEDVIDGEVVCWKVVFLTNSQANIVTDSPEIVKRLVHALDILEPKLFINLMPSFDGTEAILDGMFFDNPGVPGLESVCVNRGPGQPSNPVFAWENVDEYCKAEQKLSDFMKEVVIPLAVQTQAVVFCDAAHGQCLLSQVFGRAVAEWRAQERAKWGSQLPFTILGVCPAMPLLYKHRNVARPTAHWQFLRKNCKHWSQRDPRIRELMKNHPGWGFSSDLNPNVTSYVLLDSINESRGFIGDLVPGNLLLSALLKHFKERMPGVALKSGMSWKEKTGQRFQTGLSAVVDSLSAGIPVLGIDLRPRELEDVQGTSQAKLIEKAKYSYVAACDRLKFPDILDVCALSFFRPLIEGSLKQTRHLGRKAQVIPLYKAIEMMEWEHHGLDYIRPNHKPRELQRHTSFSMSDSYASEIEKEQFLRQDVLEWLAKDIYSRAWSYLPKADRDKNPEYDDLYGDYMHNWLKQSHFIMKHDNFYCLNVRDIGEGKKRLKELVELERLPAANTVEGLRLLRHLWDHYDICEHHARRYKIASRVLFFLQLLCQVSLAVCAFSKTLPFVISVIAATLISINALVSPAACWRQLRGSSHAIESVAWKYRTRVDEFVIKTQMPSAPDIALSESLRSWLDDFVSGTDLDESDLGRAYPNSVYTHHQYECNSKLAASFGNDDFHSPTNPDVYIELRLKSAQERFAAEIAPCRRWRICFAFAALLCTLSSALLSLPNALASMEFSGIATGLDGVLGAGELGSGTEYLGIPVAMANAIFAWSEFADSSQRMEWCQTAVRKLRQLHAWWDGIGFVAQASSENIRKLVLNTEALITGEFEAWQTISKPVNKIAVPAWPVHSWREEEVALYLQSLGIGDVRDIVYNNAIDGPLFNSISEEEWESLGFTQIKAREIRKILENKRGPSKRGYYL